MSNDLPGRMAIRPIHNSLDKKYEVPVFRNSYTVVVEIFGGVDVDGRPPTGRAAEPEPTTTGEPLPTRAAPEVRRRHWERDCTARSQALYSLNRVAPANRSNLSSQRSFMECDFSCPIAEDAPPAGAGVEDESRGSPRSQLAKDQHRC